MIKYFKNWLRNFIFSNEYDGQSINYYHGFIPYETLLISFYFLIECHKRNILIPDFVLNENHICFIWGTSVTVIIDCSDIYYIGQRTERRNYYKDGFNWLFDKFKKEFE